MAEASLVDVSPDTRAVLLLYAKLGAAGPDDPEPLKPQEYERFARWLQTVGLRPRDVLDGDALSARPHDDLPVSLPRLHALLDRHAALAAPLDDWMHKGGWVISHVESCYPRRLRDQSHFAAPPLLYGVGDLDLLSGGGLAIVGSRHADLDAIYFTRQVAAACVRQDVVVVSGGAGGVDSAAMDAALAAGGRVVGILADSLLRRATAAKYRDGLRDGQIVLLSPYHPHSGFNVGNAMGRNKYIYALADWGLVVSASLESGGTWAGAVEALQYGHHVFVRTQENMPEGNRRLLERGAHAFPEPWSRLAETLEECARAVLQSHQPGAYDLVLRLLLSYLDQPQDLPTLARLLDVHRNQVRAWVKRAIEEARIEQVAGSEPPRYVRSRQQRMPFVAESEETYAVPDGVPECDSTDFEEASIHVEG